MANLTCQVENLNPFVQYVFDFIFRTLGISGEFLSCNDESRPVDLYYGGDSTHPNCKVSICPNESDVLWQDLLEGKVSSEDVQSRIPFDIIHATGAFLSDKVNSRLPVGAYDSHERLSFSHSFQATHEIARIPIINIYINFLKSILQKICGVQSVPLWPVPKTCAIGLSHDVDVPEKYGILRAPIYANNLPLGTNLANNLKRMKDAGLSLFDHDRDNYWLFDDIMTEEQKFGFKSTFFFATVNQFDQWGTVHDVYYDIDRPNFRKLFTKLKSSGFEIGLHASYDAYCSEERFVEEKMKLERVASVTVKGLRHHYWHMGRDVQRTLMMHENSGFVYDSSIAFNDDMGFRRNVAMAYFPWVAEEMRPINTLQLPVFCMDGNLFYQQTSIKVALARVKSYVDVIRRLGGLGVIDWHVRTSFPKNTRFRDWGKAYLLIMEYLASNSDIWVTSLEDISAWLRSRDEMLNST